ncbi:hypothetical protein NX059_012235 [Plenodomus lindquistii]|nr:hypothetical protein NX059_012235 [Plenodomus lindquistii]
MCRSPLGRKNLAATQNCLGVYSGKRQLTQPTEQRPNTVALVDYKSICLVYRREHIYLRHVLSFSASLSTKEAWTSSHLSDFLLEAEPQGLLSLYVKSSGQITGGLQQQPAHITRFGLVHLYRCHWAAWEMQMQADHDLVLVYDSFIPSDDTSPTNPADLLPALEAHLGIGKGTGLKRHVRRAPCPGQTNAVDCGYHAIYVVVARAFGLDPAAVREVAWKEGELRARAARHSASIVAGAPTTSSLRVAWGLGGSPEHGTSTVNGKKTISPLARKELADWQTVAL